MKEQSTESTIDISPWPIGEGFRGTKTWWEYIWSQNETDRLNSLFLAALLNAEVCERLLAHDKSLFELFDLSDESTVVLCLIEAKTLDEFAQLITVKIGPNLPQE